MQGLTPSQCGVGITGLVNLGGGIEEAPEGGWATSRKRNDSFRINSHQTLRNLGELVGNADFCSWSGELGFKLFSGFF